MRDYSSEAIAILLSHHQKCWSLIGRNRVTWPALLSHTRTVVRVL